MNIFEVISMKKNMKQKVIIGILCFCMMMLFTGCGNKNKEECRNIINEFEYAYNELDVDAMLRCLHPNVADPIRAMLSVTNMISGEETEDIVDMIASGLGEQFEESGLDSEEMFNSLDIEITDFEKNEGTADVYADISFNLAGEPMERYGVFHMTQVNKQWYISSFEFTADTAR